MTKEGLLKKLDNMLDQAAREQTYGQIEIELRAGEPALLRKSSTEILNEKRERPHDQQPKTYR
jgi:hypothetical protein